MSGMNPDCQQNVLSPWAEADPAPLSGLSPRLDDLNDKTIGLFANNKVAAQGILAVVERKLKDKFPSSRFTHFRFDENLEVMASKDKDRFVEWVKATDAVIGAVGD